MDFVIETRPYEDDDVQRMVAEVQAVYVEMYGGPDEAVVEPGEFVPPTGMFFLGLLDGRPVATGGWRRHEEHSAEVKRMYVSLSARRLGLARRMLAEVERTAARAGVRRMVLNTGPHQIAAITLYEADGYRPCTPFGHYAHLGGAVFFDKSLSCSGG